MARERPSAGRRTEHPAAGEAGPAAVREADVILDVEFEAGLLFLVLRNLGDLPAHAVRVKLEPPFRGLGGTRAIASLPLFRRLEFLAPQKSIRVFLDRAAVYLARGEPTAIEATVRWRTRSGESRSEVIRHDLEIYRDLPHVEREVDVRCRP